MKLSEELNIASCNAKTMEDKIIILQKEKKDLQGIIEREFKSGAIYANKFSVPKYGLKQTVYFVTDKNNIYTKNNVCDACGDEGSLILEDGRKIECAKCNGIKYTNYWVYIHTYVSGEVTRVNINTYYDTDNKVRSSSTYETDISCICGSEIEWKLWGNKKEIELYILKQNKVKVSNLIKNYPEKDFYIRCPASDEEDKYIPANEYLELIEKQLPNKN